MRLRNDLAVGDHVRLRELECPCCRAVLTCPVLVSTLDQLRRDGRHFSVATGYRCRWARERGELTCDESGHDDGTAADLMPHGEGEWYALRDAAASLPHVRLVEFHGYWHLSVREEER